ncbi:MAG: succinate dehydrogenase assembly factor 2 [Hyphomicrobiaceae bacterium]
METTELEIRRRRALFRAIHRGTKEMDWLLGRFAKAKLADMNASELGTFEQLLSISDPDLNDWILDPMLIENREFGPLVTALRAFHGLEELTDKAAS